MFGISIPDFIVLLGYFAGITYLGFWTRKKIKTSGDFFMANRRFGKWLMMAQAFGTGTHTDQPVSVAGASYTTGISGIWYQWLWLFSTPFYWIISPIYRRLRYVTMADFFKERYGNGMAIFYTLVGLIYFSMNIGLMLKGTGVAIEGLTGGMLPERATIFIATLLFMAYGLAGGLIAAVFTDAVQAVLILVLSFMLIPFALIEAGGFHAIKAGLPPEMFHLVAPQEITPFFVAMIVINGLVGVVVQPHHMAIGGSSKTEIASRIGWCYGNFVKRFATVGWAFTGVFAAFLYPGLGFSDRELAFGMIAKNLLPVGFVGLMIAAMLAAVMSTCDAFMVHSSALFTRNLYLPFINPRASDRQQLKVGRLSAIFVVISGIFFAFYFPSVVDGLMQLWKVTAYLGVAFWMGVMWPRANRYGAMASALIMAGIAIYTGEVLHWPLANQIALYIPAGFLAMVVFSLITPPEAGERLHKFYTLLRTPVGQEAKLREAGIEIVLEGESQATESRGRRSWLERWLASPDSDDLILPELLSGRKRISWRRHRTDLLGFAVAMGWVFVIILMVYGLVRL